MIIFEIIGYAVLAGIALGIFIGCMLVACVLLLRLFGVEL